MTEKKIDYRSVILVFLLIAGLAVLVLLQRRQSYEDFAQQAPVKIGRPAPDFGFSDMNGKMIRLSDHKGKVVLVNIWATWCASCVHEIPSLEKLYQKLKGENFEILAVSIDASGVKALAPFIKKYKITFPVLIDSAGTIKEKYGITGVPESFIIDKNGALANKIIGPLDWIRPEVLHFFRNLIQKP